MRADHCVLDHEDIGLSLLQTYCRPLCVIAWQVNGGEEGGVDWGGEGGGREEGLYGEQDDKAVDVGSRGRCPR